MEQTRKYSVLKILKVKKPYGFRHVMKMQEVYPYKMNKIGHAQACARMVNASIDYNGENNKIVNVIVQDDLGNIVFVARTNINGVPGDELGDSEL